MNHVISIEHLTKDYGDEKGVFDVSLQIKKGEVFGFLGPNGAGKTTTIRHLMGFLHPQSGSATILDMDCMNQCATIQKEVGYLPGEGAYFDEMSGKQFIKFMAEYRGMKDMRRAEELMKFFELDPSGRLKKMSKGMKQKVGIVCAFMHDPQILILDEPTSGLDPLMQNRFIELIQQEKKRGKTILMSSHMFEEIERTCDRVGIIKDGHIVAIEDVETIKNTKRRTFVITFENEQVASAFKNEKLTITKQDKAVVEVQIQGNAQALFKHLQSYSILDVDVVKESLEEIFLHFYGGEHHE